MSECVRHLGRNSKGESCMDSMVSFAFASIAHKGKELAASAK
jgi:hypothetical protein